MAEELNWNAHMDTALTEGHPAQNIDASGDWAIDLLQTVGCTDSDDERVQRAQTYLQLAALYVPELVNISR